MVMPLKNNNRGVIMITKDPGKKHFYFSMIKSGFRIAGCVSFLVIFFWWIQWTLLAFGVFVMAFLVAEVIGIIEEF